MRNREDYVWQGTVLSAIGSVEKESSVVATPRWQAETTTRNPLLTSTAEPEANPRPRRDGGGGEEGGEDGTAHNIIISGKHNRGVAHSRRLHQSTIELMAWYYVLS